MADEPWLDEHYHRDSNFDLWPDEKLAAARYRLSRTYAAAMAHMSRPAFVALATKLRTCREGHRCGSGICPQCGTAQKRRFIERVVERFGTEFAALLTIIPSEPALHPTKLRDLDIDEHKAALAGSLRAVGLETLPLIGAMDFTWNTYDGMVTASFWSPHWHCFIEARDRDEIERRLRQIYLKTIYVKKPIDGKAITRTPERAYSYGFKSIFYARHQTIHAPNSREKPDYTKISHTHPKFSTLALNLDRIGLSERTFGQA